MIRLTGAGTYRRTASPFGLRRPPSPWRLRVSSPRSTSGAVSSQRRPRTLLLTAFTTAAAALFSSPAFAGCPLPVGGQPFGSTAWLYFQLYCGGLACLALGVAWLAVLEWRGRRSVLLIEEDDAP